MFVDCKLQETIPAHFDWIAELPEGDRTVAHNVPAGDRPAQLPEGWELDYSGEYARFVVPDES